jgi:dTDP-glucose 4,6-dehydratase
VRTLVTGAAGFIGSTYVRVALDARPDAQVVVLDKLTYAGRRENLADVEDRIEFVEGAIEDRDVVARAMTGATHVVNFAAESHVDRSIAAAAAFATTNVVGTQVLLDAALRHGVGRFVHVSTDEVYGSIAAGAWSERSPVSPNSPYAATKAGSDLLALAYHRTHGLPVVVTRSANNYGPYQHPEKLIPRFVTNLLEGRTVPLYGDGSQIRDWVHVDDHCRGVALALLDGRAGEVYHIGGTTELSNRQLTERLLHACGAGWDRVVTVADRKGHDQRYALDDDRIRRELGYRPRVDFGDGLAATVQWYRDNRDWWRPLVVD